MTQQTILDHPQVIAMTNIDDSHFVILETDRNSPTNVFVWYIVPVSILFLSNLSDKTHVLFTDLSMTGPWNKCGMCTVTCLYGWMLLMAFHSSWHECALSGVKARGDGARMTLTATKSSLELTCILLTQALNDLQTTDSYYCHCASGCHCLRLSLSFQCGQDVVVIIGSNGDVGSGMWAIGLNLTNKLQGLHP